MRRIAKNITKKQLIDGIKSHTALIKSIKSDLMEAENDAFDLNCVIEESRERLEGAKKFLRCLKNKLKEKP